MGSPVPAVSNRPDFRGSKEESLYTLTKMITLSSIPTFTGFSGDDDNSSDAGLTKEERKEKYRKQEEEREAIRQKLREKYKIERPRDESIEEPEEESFKSESDSEEEEEEIDEEKEREREYLEELSKKIAIILSSIVAGFFSLYLLTSFVHLKLKAAVHNMRPPFVERLWVW